MKKYRRIEITAFRRRITIHSVQVPPDPTEVQVADNDSPVTIDVESQDGQKILIEAIRVLEEKLSK